MICCLLLFVVVRMKENAVRWGKKKKRWDLPFREEDDPALIFRHIVYIGRCRVSPVGVNGRTRVMTSLWAFGGVGCCLSVFGLKRESVHHIPCAAIDLIVVDEDRQRNSMAAAAAAVAVIVVVEPVRCSPTANLVDRLRAMAVKAWNRRIVCCIDAIYTTIRAYSSKKKKNVIINVLHRCRIKSMEKYLCVLFVRYHHQQTTTTKKKK